MPPDNSRGERGIALIAVLVLVLCIGVLAASAVTLSQFSAAEVDTFCSLQRSAYRLESALNRIVLLLARDRQQYADRSPENADYRQTERFMADGVIHRLEVDAETVQFRITDAASGVDISGTAPSRQLRNREWNNAEDRERWLRLLACLDDYADRDEFVRENGMERMHYRENGIPALPRNNVLQFREELRWIPGASAFFPPGPDGLLTPVRIIPPPKLRAIAGRPNLYAATPEWIIVLARLTEQEGEALKESLRLWVHERRPLAETMPPGISGKLSVAFSTRETGIYTISVQGGNTEQPTGRLSATLELNANPRRLEYYSFQHH